MATIQTLSNAQWEPRKLDEWFQQDGTSWLTRDDVGADSNEMIMEFASRQQRSVRSRAAKHHSGQGLKDVAGTGCQAVRRVMKNIARSLDCDGLACQTLAFAAVGTSRTKCVGGTTKRQRTSSIACGSALYINKSTRHASTRGLLDVGTAPSKLEANSATNGQSITFARGMESAWTRYKDFYTD